MEMKTNLHAMRQAKVPFLCVVCVLCCLLFIQILIPIKGQAASDYNSYIYSTGSHWCANCATGETGASNQTAGDQSGNEYKFSKWAATLSNGNSWITVFRYPDQNVALKIAQLSIDAVNNDHIGYDWGYPDRETYWNELKKVNYNPSAITVDCEADCSSAVCTNVRAAGYLLGISALQNVKMANTSTLTETLRTAGFIPLTDSKYLTQKQYLLPGDILLASGHTMINLTKGANASWVLCPAAPTPVVTCSDQYHSVDITWAETTGQDFYSLRLYDASGETRIYLRDYIQHTAYSALLLQPGNYWAEVATVVENVQVNTSTKVPFTVTAGTLPDMPSPLDWRLADGKLFRLYPVGGTWLTDKALAAQAGGHLAYITNQTRQNAIFEMVSAAGQWAYLGGHGHYYTWQWINGSALTSGYTNWGANKPDNYGGTENVLMMYPSDGTWEDVPCSYTPYYVVEFDPVSLDLSFYQPSWTQGADQIRDNVSVGVNFSDGSCFLVDDFGLSYVENEEEITVTVSWGGLSATGSVSVADNPPEITACWIENEDYWGYDVCVNAADDNGVAYYVFGTWHEPQTIDNAFWEPIQAEEDGSVRYHVDIANYDYAANVNYFTRVIVFDAQNQRGEIEYDASVYVPMIDLYEQRVEELTLKLPAALTTIEEDAFQGVAAQYFVLPPTVTTIESNAFPENAVVYLYGSSIQSLGPNLFGGGPGIFVEMGEVERWMVEVFDGTEVSYVLRNSVVPKLWSEWSDWSTEPVEPDENTQVATKTQYRSTAITYETRYTDWSAWSSWSLTQEAIPDANLKQEQTEVVYPYYCFICPTCGWHSPYHGTGKCINGHNIPSSSFDISVYSITTPKSGCTKYDSTKYMTVYNGENWYYWDDGSDPANQTIKTLYSYRTRTAYQEAVTGVWSDWSDTPVIGSDSVSVETRTVYRFRTKN